MQEVGRFFYQIWLSYLNDLSLIEQVLAATPLIAYAFGMIRLTRSYYQGRELSIMEELETYRAAAENWQKRYNQLSRKHELINEKLPERWIQRFQEEMKSGNDGKGIGLLRDEFRDSAPYLAQAADVLAEFHTSIIWDQGEQHVPEALRWTRIAALLDRPTLERRGLVDELERMQINPRGHDESLFATWDDIYQAFPLGQDASAAVLILRSTMGKRSNEGRFRMALHLYRRAMRIVARNPEAVPSDTRIDIQVRGIGYMLVLDLNEEALKASDVLIREFLDDPSLNPLFLYKLRNCKAHALANMGRFDEAVAEIQGFRAAEASHCGPESQQARLTTFRLASVLDVAGRSEEAMPLFDQILAAKSLDIQDRLNAMQGKSRNLHNLGRYEEADAAFCALIPMERSERSADHPYSLVTLLFFAWNLLELGRLDEANRVADEIEPAIVRQLGKQHFYFAEFTKLRNYIIDKLQKNRGSAAGCATQ